MARIVRPQPRAGIKLIKKQKLSEYKITQWMKAFRKQEGYYPNYEERKPVPGQPHETWSALNSALREPSRGLKKRSSLSKIRNQIIGVTGIKARLPMVEVTLEPKRTIPLVTDAQRQYLPRIPLMDRSILTRYLAGETQQEIADTYSITQAGVSYRISGAIRKLMYLEQASKVSDKEFEYGLKLVEVPELDIKVLCALRYLGQSHTATKLGLTQGKVRHILYRTFKQRGPALIADPNLRPVLYQLELIRDNPAVLVERPANHHSY